MNDEDPLANAVYQVVINHEEQYSIWLDGREIPAGWHAVGKSGPKDECLEYIDRVWTDMRPLSLRKKMEEMKRVPPPPIVEEAIDTGPDIGRASGDRTASRRARSRAR